MCPGLSGVGLLECGHDVPRRSRVRAQALPRRVPPQGARSGCLSGRPIAQIASDLGISDQTIYGWRRQELIDTGQLSGLNRAEQAELAAANKRIRELETEVAILKRARELLREYAAIATMDAEGLPVQKACRLLSVAESGYYEWRSRPPSARAVRHAWLTEQIRAVHTASRGTYGARRVHASV